MKLAKREVTKIILMKTGRINNRYNDAAQKISIAFIDLSVLIVINLIQWRNPSNTQNVSIKIKYTLSVSHPLVKPPPHSNVKFKHVFVNLHIHDARTCVGRQCKTISSNGRT
jgi:hypothetical protein